MTSMINTLININAVYNLIERAAIARLNNDLAKQEALWDAHTALLNSMGWTEQDFDNHLLASIGRGWSNNYN